MRMRARCGTLVQSHPTNLLAKAGDLHNHKHTRSKMGVGFHTALLIPPDARSKLRCGGLGMASVPIPKFASLRGTLVCELGIKGTLAIYDSSAVLDLKFLHKPAAIMIGTSNPPH